MMALASRASSRAVAATPRRDPSASARASAGDFFADGDIVRGCNAALGTCGRLGIRLIDSIRLGIRLIDSIVFGRGNYGQCFYICTLVAAS